MQITRQKLVIGSAVVGVVLLAVLVGLFFRGGDSPFGEPVQEVSTLDPIDTTLDFYDAWLRAVQSTTTDPYAEELHTTPILGHELRKHIADAEGRAAGELDPVLCQTKTPVEISGRPVYESEERAQVLVRSREKGWQEQAVVTLVRHNEGWYIGDISCSSGEVAPEREFDFEMEGFLLKSVEPPLDSQYWHLVFEQNGQQGHVVPLFFSAESRCTDADGNEGVCAPDTFIEPSRAMVRGAMTDAGVEVKRVEMVE